MLFSLNACSAKAKAMYGKRLRKEDYEQLLRKTNVQEVAAYLKNESEYASVLSDVHEKSIHRGQLEALLKRDSFLRRKKLLRYIQGAKQEFYHYAIALEEVAQILGCVRAISAKDASMFVSDLPLFLNKYMSFDLKKLMEVKNYKDLWEILKNTMYAKVVEPFLCKENAMDYTMLEKNLAEFLYQRQIELIEKTFKGKEREDIRNLFITQMELRNICKIYRMKEYYHASKETIEKYLVKAHSRIGKNVYEALLNAKDGEEVLKILENSAYKLYVDSKDFIYIEYYCKKIKYHLGKRFMHFSNSAPLVYMTYFILDEIEVENVINIIEGIRYNVAAEKISALLIY